MRVRGYIYNAAQYALCLSITITFAIPAYAEVVLDGTLGAKGSITGPNFNITSSMGQIYGGNLFHSFSNFNLNNTESAIFSGPSTVTNIISRVTGGQASSIDGTIKSTITGADFWFINPSGMVFGQNAKLDVGGSFHASTADYIKLGDDNRFDASNPETPILTSASPSAFGFLGNNPNSITLKDGAFLKVSEGKTLSLVGGNLNIQDSNLYASSGTINLVSVASAGEAVVYGQNFKVDTFNKLGEINIKETRSYEERPVSDLNTEALMGNMDTSGTGGGNIFIRGGKFFSDGGRLNADTYGNISGSGIDIAATDSVNVSGGASLISSQTYDKGKAGNISIETAKLDITDVAQISTSSRKGSEGDGGNITIKTTGPVDISGHLLIGGVYLGSAISSETYGTGRAGNISIETSTLNISDGAHIYTNARAGSSGEGGNITIKAADSVSISGHFLIGATESASSSISSETYGKGKAGNISIETTQLNISEGAYIATNARAGSSGEGGNITIRAVDSVNISGHFLNGAQQTVASSINSRTLSKGKGGSISLNTGRLNLSEGGEISAKSTGSGNAGDIDITASDAIQLTDSAVTTAADSSGGGQIYITAGHMINLLNSETTATVAGGTGNGGNISTKAPYIILNNSRIIAKAEEGHGGDIIVNIDNYFKSPDSEVDASSKKNGFDGKVVVSSPVIDMSGKIAIVLTRYIDIAALVPKQCVEREEELSSFAVKGRDGLPPFPDSLLAIP